MACACKSHDLVKEGTLMPSDLIGALVRFRPEGTYQDFHNAVGLVISNNKPSHVRVRWLKPVHYAVASEHYIHYGPTNVSDFGLDRFEIINKRENNG